MTMPSGLTKIPGWLSTGTGRQAETELDLSDLWTWLNALRAYAADGLLTISTLAITVAAEKFKTTTTAFYRIGGVHYSKAATDNLVFSGVSTINVAAAATTAHWGAFLVQVNAAGVVSTLPAAYTSGTDQDYATEALAIAKLPAPTALNVQLGYITVQTKASTNWIEATSDMTPASDCTAANFYDLPAPATLPAVLV